jgi:hypothetical protein
MIIVWILLGLLGLNIIWERPAFGARHLYLHYEEVTDAGPPYGVWGITWRLLATVVVVGLVSCAVAMTA